jgi:hypothetical protein
LREICEKEPNASHSKDCEMRGKCNMECALFRKKEISFQRLLFAYSKVGMRICCEEK